MNEQISHSPVIKAIIGLGNPGLKFARTRHNIGFRIIDALAQRQDIQWRKQELMDVAHAGIDEQTILLIKPQTFMNSSGQVIPSLHRDGIASENILVIHDELELPLGTIKVRIGGSHRGHNGLKSLIQYAGPDFVRLRCGISRPENRDDVPDYVLAPFDCDEQEIVRLIDRALELIVAVLRGERQDS